MDLYAFAEQHLTLEELYWIVDGGDVAELRQLQEIVQRRCWR